MFKIQASSKFKRQLKSIVSQGKDIQKLNEVVEILQNGGILPPKFKDHKLKGSKRGLRECHVEPDWLLIYKIEKTDLLLMLIETGSHSELLNL